MKRTPFLPKHRCANPICKHPLDFHSKFGTCCDMACSCKNYVKSLRAHAQMRAKSLGIRRSKGKTNYKQRLWKVFSEWTRRYDADAITGEVACVTCGKVDHWKNHDAGHYHPRTAGLALYFDERNVHPQCTGCNRFRHGNLPAYALFLQKTYGPGILEELDAKRREFRKISDVEYLELIALYQNKLEAMNVL